METPLNIEVSFNAFALNNTSLPAADRKALLAFETRVSDLGRAVNGASRELQAMQDEIKAMREALNYVANANPEWMLKAKNISEQLKLLNVKMEGDPTLSSRNENQPPSITSRINDVIYGIYGSTSAPTQTMIDALATAIQEFEPVLAKLRLLKENDIKQLELQLDQLGAPWTPGRLPDWKK